MAKTLEIITDDAMAVALEDYCQRNHCNLSQVMRMAMRQFIPAEYFDQPDWRARLTPFAIAVIERMVRDHSLDPEVILSAAMDEILYYWEEDVIEKGRMSGGELEWGFVQTARRHNPRRKVHPVQRRDGHSNHQPGSVSFFEVFGSPERIAKLKRECGCVAPKLLAV